MSRVWWTAESLTELRETARLVVMENPDLDVVEFGRALRAEFAEPIETQEVIVVWQMYKPVTGLVDAETGKVRSR